MFPRHALRAWCLVLAGVGSAFAQPAPQTADDRPRHVYVPVDDLDAVINRDNGGVMLSRDEYDELDQAARAAAPDQGQLPSGAVLSQASYAARISDDQLLVTVTAELTSFTNGWARVVLPSGGAGVESAALDGEPAKLARDAQQPTALVLYVAEPGEHSLTLELSTPLVTVGGEQAAAFELHGAPVGLLTLKVPSGKRLSVNGAQPERPAEIDAEAEYSVPVGGLKAVRLRITDRAATATGDALTFAQSAIGVYVAPGEITWSARTALQIYGREIDTLVCTVPKTLELTAVESSGLESWELADAPDAEDRTQITLHYRQPWDGVREITFRGIVPADAEAAWSVSDLTIREVTSHVGRAVVQFPPGVRLQMVDAVGIRPVLAVDGMDPAAPSLEYEIWQESFRLAFVTATKAREVHAAMTTLVDVNADGLDLSVTLDARSLFAPLFNLQLQIPAEWTVRSATVGGSAVDWQVVPLEAGVNQVQIPLNPPLAVNESRTFTLVAHRDPEGWPVEDAPITFALPEVRLPQVGVIEALYGIAVDEDLDAQPVDVAGLDPARKDDFDLLNAKLQAFGRSIRLGYTFQDTVFSGQLAVSRRPSRVAAATVLFFRADKQSLSGHMESQLDVTGGGIRELQAAVSESAGLDLRFRLLQQVMMQGRNGEIRPAFRPSARIVEQIPGEPADGMRSWTLKFDRRLRGRFVLAVDVQTPLPTPTIQPAADDAAADGAGGDDAATADESFSPFVMTIPGADRETGHIAIESSGEQQVRVTSADASGAALPSVDPVDFPPALYRSAERVVAGFRYAQPGWTMSIARTEFDRQPVPTAVIHSAQLKSVISETGEMQNQADYSLTAIGVQSLRLQFSQNHDGTPPELWAVLVDGRPVEVRSSEAGQFIALPPAGSPQQTRSLRVSYRTKSTPLDQASGRLHQSPPRLAAVSGAGEEQPLEILDQQWTVHHPQGTLLVDSQGRFHPRNDLDRDSFLGRIGQLLRAPAPDDLAFGGVAVLVAIGIAWLLSLGYARLRFVGVILALLVVGAIGIAFMLPAVQSAREAARRTVIQNNLRQRGVAVHGYHDSMNEVPASTPNVDFGTLQDMVVDAEASEAGEADASATTQMPPPVGHIEYDEPQGAAASERMRSQLRGSQRTDPFESSNANRAGGAGFGGGAGGVGGGFPADADDRTVIGAPGAGGARMDDGLDIPFRQGSFQLGTPDFGGSQPQMSDGHAPNIDLNIQDSIAGPRVDQNLAPLAPFGAVDPINPQSAAPAQQPSRVSGRFSEGDQSQQAAQPVPAQPGQDIDGDGFINEPVSEVFVSGLSMTQTGRGALLSLTFNLQPPPDYVARDFVYRGDVTVDNGADLKLVYASRRAGRGLSFAIAVAAILLCWMSRRRSLGDRLVVAAALLLAPIGLMTIAPTIWLPVLDGLFLGGLIGLALWGVRCLISWCEECCLRPRTSAKTTASIVALCGALLLGESAARAEDAPSQPAAPVVEAASDVPEQPAAADSEQLPPGIILPYDAGSDPLTSERVFLSHEQFLKLWNRAHPDQRLPVTAPVDGLVSEALYAAKIEGEGDAARIAVTARFVVHSLRTQQVTLPLPLKSVALTSSTVDGAPASLQAEGGDFSVVLDDPGAHVLDVSFTVPAQIAGPAGRFILPLLPVPAGKLSFELPAGDDLLVRVDGSSTAYRIREQDGARYLETPIDQGGDIAVSWRPKTQRGDAGTVVHAYTTTALLVGDAGLTHGHAIVYRVRQGSVNEFAFRAPLGLSLKRIAGPDVGGWELSDTGDARQFRVFLRRAVDDETSLILEFHEPVSVTDQPQSLAVPEIALDDVARETGLVGLYAPQHFVVRAEAAGASQINAGTFAAPLLGGLPAEAPRLAFRYASRPLGLLLTVSRRQPETRVAAEHGVRVELRKLHIASRIRYELTGAPRLALSFDLPAGYLPLSVQAQFLADWYVSGEPDARVLTIELDQPRTGAVEVVLEGHVQRAPDEAAAEIVVPQPLSVNRLQSRLAVWLDSSYTASLDTLGDWKSADPAALSDALRGLNPRQPQFGFQSASATPGAVSLSLSRATPQLIADCITLAAVSETSVDYGLTLRWRIRQAAADTFVLVTPGWLKGRLDFDGPGIRNVSSADLDDGRVRWTIALVDPVENEYLMTAVATLPPPTDLLVALPDVQFEQPGDGGTFAPLATQAQFAVLVNLSGWQMSPVEDAVVNSIGRDELPFELRDELLNQAMEIARIESGSAPAWQLERLAQVASADATVTAADLNTVLDYDGSWRLKAVYTVRNRGRQFLALNLPDESRVLSVFVRGAPSRTVLTTLEGRDVHLVALPQTSIADLSFDVQLVLAGRLPSPLPEGFNLVGREIELPSPSVVSSEQAQAAGRGDLGTPVIHTQWTVELPDGIDATIVDASGRSNMTPEEASWELALSRAEADVSELTKVLEDPFASAIQKRQAAGNLKQLNTALQNQQSALSSSGRDIDLDLKGGTDLYFARNGELQQEVERNLRLYESNNGIMEGDASGILLGTPQYDAGRDFINSNSALILQDNPISGADAGSQPQSSSESTFNFALSESKSEDASSGKAVRKKDAAESRGKLREQLKEQSVEELEHSYRQRGALPLERPSGLQSHTIRNLPDSDPRVQAEQEGQFWGTLNDVEWGLAHRVRDGREMVYPDDWNEMSRRQSLPQNLIGRENWNDRTVNGLTAPESFDQPDGLSAREIEAEPQFQKRFLERAIASQPSSGLAVPKGFADMAIDPQFLGYAGGRFGDGGEGGAPAARVWTAAGGLSLPIAIPSAEQRLRFDKVGGEPKLTLAVRPRRALTLSLGAIWTLVCLIGGLWLVGGAIRSEGRDVWRIVPKVLAAVGLLGFLLIPGGARWLPFVLFAAAMLWWFVQRRRAALADDE